MSNAAAAWARCLAVIVSLIALYALWLMCQNFILGNDLPSNLLEWIQRIALLLVAGHFTIMFGWVGLFGHVPRWLFMVDTLCFRGDRTNR